MKWRDIFGSKQERKDDRVESRYTVVVLFLVVVVATLVAWISAQTSKEPNLVFYIAMPVAALGFIFFLQEIMGLFLTHTIGVKPLILLAVPVVLIYGTYSIYSTLVGE